MPDQPRPDEVQMPRITCEVCLKEVPRSQAKNRESADTMLYFCGLECYEKWTRTQGAYAK